MKFAIDIASAAQFINSSPGFVLQLVQSGRVKATPGYTHVDLFDLKKYKEMSDEAKYRDEANRHL